ncbi:MAG: hypothetical protein LBE32_06715 [Burkholderiales bacterium]|jgi:hypothetical protein|nr:hypothetical protein [Burkholderiales bacterium]
MSKDSNPSRYEPIALSNESTVVAEFVYPNEVREERYQSEGARANRCDVTVLVNDLSSDRPAEIKARRQQYEHYRDRLLTFREAA